MFAESDEEGEELWAGPAFPILPAGGGSDDDPTAGLTYTARVAKAAAPWTLVVFEPVLQVTLVLLRTTARCWQLPGKLP